MSSSSRTITSNRERIPSGRSNFQSSQQMPDEKIYTARDKIVFEKSMTMNNKPASFTQKSASLGRPQSKGPFSPRYIERSVAIPDPPARTRILQCPDDFIDTNEEQELALNVHKLKDLNAKSRADFISSFIERNSEKMWKYDHNFRGKGMQEIHEMIYNKKDFGPAMAKYCSLERKYGISSSSDNIRSCLRYGEVEPLEQPTKYDPYIESLTTSRTARNERMTAMFRPVTTRHVNRCEKHDSEWGNFSSFVGDLKRNETAMLKR